MEAGLFSFASPPAPSPPCGEGGRKGRAVTQAELTTTPRFTQARGFTLWLTGLSGAGKPTLASAVAVEVHVKASLEECVRRDTKGLYARALAGEIAQFTGVSDPYEEPLAPELVIDTERDDVATSAVRVIDRLLELGHLRSRSDA